mgnify:CR=1 FL=1
MKASQPSIWMQLFPFILMIVIFYFLLIKPQQKQAKLRQKMLNELKVGDKVLTAGGIIGTISSIRDNEIEIEIAKNVKITVVRSAVTTVVTDEPVKQ